MEIYSCIITYDDFCILFIFGVDNSAHCGPRSNMGFCGAFHVAKFRTSLCKKNMPLPSSLPMTHPNPDYCVSNITEQPAMAGETTEIVTCVSLNTNRLYVPVLVVASLTTAPVISVEASLPPCKILLHNLFSSLSISTGFN